MKKVFAFLATLMLLCVPVMASGSGASHGHGLAEVPLWLCIPFAGLLLSIAVFALMGVLLMLFYKSPAKE